MGLSRRFRLGSDLHENVVLGSSIVKDHIVRLLVVVASRSVQLHCFDLESPLKVPLIARSGALGTPVVEGLAVNLKAGEAGAFASHHQLLASLFEELLVSAKQSANFALARARDQLRNECRAGKELRLEVVTESLHLFVLNVNGDAARFEEGKPRVVDIGVD